MARSLEAGGPPCCRPGSAVAKDQRPGGLAPARAARSRFRPSPARGRWRSRLPGGAESLDDLELGPDVHRGEAEGEVLLVDVRPAIGEGRNAQQPEWEPEVEGDVDYPEACRAVVREPWLRQRPDRRGGQVVPVGGVGVGERR